MPAASVVGVAGELLDGVFVARPELLGRWREALARITSPALSAHKEATDAGRLGDDAATARLRQLAAFAYYSSPEVRIRLGIPPDGGDAVRPELVPGYITEGLLDHLLDDA
jgi:hypothetical protein